MSKKFYAVKKGYVPGIYQTWEDTKKQVNGFSGAVYKSFFTLGEAEQFINNFLEASNNISSIITNDEIDLRITSMSTNEVVSFVDGSYNDKIKKVGYGVVIIDQSGNKSTYYKSFDKNYGEDFISLRNVAGELEGAKEAVEIAISNHKKKITIFYDYDGIEKWLTEEWVTKNTFTKKYVEFMRHKMTKIQIEFVKVQAHSRIQYNEEADTLAKKSLLAKGYKTYKDGSVYFVGYSFDDWSRFVNNINKENKESLQNNNEEIKITHKNISNTREQLIIMDLKNKVSINLYNNSKSYVQGRQSVLFQKLIATAVESLSSEQIVVETLNSYHALNITKEEVEVYFDKLLPDYKGNYNDKIYLNLLSATYNTMFTGYMPDYTCLVTPIFRTYEYCLHKILGEKMKLETKRDNGTNIFSYFTKKVDGSYECNNLAKEILNKKQKEYLDEFYTDYNSIRHTYSHWSADDYNVAMINSMEMARDFLKKGLILVNKYYKLF